MLYYFRGGMRKHKHVFVFKIVNILPRDNDMFILHSPCHGCKGTRSHGIDLFRQHSWWRHQLETFPTSLAICEGNSPVTGEFPAQRPVTRSFEVFFDLRLNKWLSKQSRGWWFETSSCPLWRHSNDSGPGTRAVNNAISVWKSNMFPHNNHALQKKCEINTAFLLPTHKIGLVTAYHIAIRGPFYQQR